MSTIKKEEYLCLCAMLRARETRLLTRERADRMIDASTAEEAARMLTECGYEDFSHSDRAALETALSARQAALLDELERMSPDPALVRFFRLRYDYHNVKALLKAEAMGADAAHVMSECGRISPEALTAANAENRIGDLPEAMGKALCEAKTLLAETGNPQKMDFLLDRACFAEQYEIAKESGSRFLLDFFRLRTDLANLKTAVRACRMQKPESFLREALLPGGTLGEDSFCGAAEALAAIADSLRVPAELCAAACAGGKLTAFERACDDALTAFLQAAKGAAYGEEPLIAFLAAAEAETTAVRMILTGRLAGIAPQVIRERMRECYA